MKSPFALALLILITHSLHAQNVTGLFSGKLENDSTKKQQQYELALLDYRGKIKGYSYTTFVVNDTFYYSIKEVTGIKKDNVLIVEDEKMLVNNFPQRPDKGVHVINTIALEPVDTQRFMNGTWRTTEVRNRKFGYYSIHGSMALVKENDSTRSSLISHLQELNILPPPARYDVVKVKETKDKVKIKTEPKAKETPVAEIKIPYDQRGSKALQEITITSDSLVLSFYDNGVVDGDSISVFVNGKNIIDRQKLKEAAVKKTIYLKEFTEPTLQLTLVAENLGTIPPNTGLLIVQDGEQRYQINFSADLQTNATLIMRRKKNGSN